MKRIMALVIITIVAAGCAPGLIVPPPPPPPHQDPAKILWVTDSIGWQFELGGGVNDWPDKTIDFHSGPGWTAAKCAAPLNCVAPLGYVSQQVNKGNVGRLYVELGTNDGFDGWNSYDEIVWTALLDAPPQSTGIVIVLPKILPPACDSCPNWDAARAWMQHQAEVRPNVAVIDWAPYFEQPDVADPRDGVHLNTDGGNIVPPPDGVIYVDPAAMSAYRDMATAAMQLADERSS